MVTITRRVACHEDGTHSNKIDAIWISIRDKALGSLTTLNADRPSAAAVALAPSLVPAAALMPRL